MYNELNQDTPHPSRQCSRRDSKRTSVVWDHFNRIEEGGKVRTVYIYCGKTYSLKNHETNNLWAHLNNQYPEYSYKISKYKRIETLPLQLV